MILKVVSTIWFLHLFSFGTAELETIKPETEKYYPVIRAYHLGATEVAEKEYPWVARVLIYYDKEARYGEYACTATFIRTNILVTAARCLLRLWTTIAKVDSMGQILDIRAFVMPSELTPMVYDDIGFIVVSTKTMSRNRRQEQQVLEIRAWNRTNPDFPPSRDYFTPFYDTYGYKEEKEKFNSEVYGFTHPKSLFKHSLTADYASFQPRVYLTKLPAYLDYDACTTMFNPYENSDQLYATCYYFCEIENYKSSDESLCAKHQLATEGAAVVTPGPGARQLIGIAMWQPYRAKSRREMPVGFTAPGSDTFWKDLKCAEAITKSTLGGNFQKLVPECQD